MTTSDKWLNKALDRKSDEPAYWQINQYGNMRIATDNWRLHILTDHPDKGDCKLSTEDLKHIENMLAVSSTANFTATVFHLTQMTKAAVAFRDEHSKKTAPDIHITINSKLSAWAENSDIGRMSVELENGYQWPLKDHKQKEFVYSHSGADVTFTIPSYQLLDALSGPSGTVTVEFVPASFIRLTDSTDRATALISLCKEENHE